MATLIRRHGGEPTIAPSMQEVPLDNNQAVFDFVEQLLAGRYDAVVFLTGVGAKAMRDIAERRHSTADLLGALRKTTIIVRGPKPAAVMREWQVPITVRAPEPNTWQELVAAIDQSDVDLNGGHLAVQEYGQPSEDLYAALQQRGAKVTAVPVYRWMLPDDLGPLESAIKSTIDPGFDLLLFTSAQQVRHVLEVACRLGCESEWRSAAEQSVIASIGPTCSQTLQECGLTVHIEPSHPKMGTLVREAVAAAPALLQSRQSS